MKRIKRSLILCIAFAVVLLCALLLCSCSGEKAEESNGAFDYKAVRPEYQEDIGTYALMGHFFGGALDLDSEDRKEHCQHNTAQMGAGGVVYIPTEGYVRTEDHHILSCFMCENALAASEEHEDVVYRRASSVDIYKVYYATCGICGKERGMSVGAPRYFKVILTVKNSKTFQEEYGSGSAQK